MSHPNYCIMADSTDRFTSTNEFVNAYLKKEDDDVVFYNGVLVNMIKGLSDINKHIMPSLSSIWSETFLQDVFEGFEKLDKERNGKSHTVYLLYDFRSFRPHSRRYPWHISPSKFFMMSIAGNSISNCQKPVYFPNGKGQHIVLELNLCPTAEAAVNYGEMAIILGV